MLPRDWVERIHTRLLARYGSAWIRMWEGIDPEAVKADWSEELSGISADRIRYALDHLPADRPPMSAQFKAIAYQMPPEPYRALAAPSVDPDRVIEAKAKLKAVADKIRARPFI